MNDFPESSDLFGAFYYAHGCGEPYTRNETWLGLFQYFANLIVRDFQPKTVLDAGCAMGFLVEGLRARGVEAWGVDISQYAIAQVHESIRAYCWEGSILDPFPRQYDLIVCIEVLEHLPPGQAEKAIANLCSHTSDILFSSTPFDYKETTHFNVQPPEYWADLFARQGFYRDVDFDATGLTPWAVRFRKQSEPVHRVVRNYERSYWALSKENYDLRQLNLELRTQLTGNASGERTGMPLMIDPEEQAAPPPRKIVSYSTYYWPHAVAALRVVRPIEAAGLELIPGNDPGVISVERVAQADIVLLQREFPLYWEQYQQILSLARSLGKPVVYEIDDLLIDLPDDHPDRAIDYYTPAILPILHAITVADLVTTTTATLAHTLRRFNPNVVVLPNYLDDRDWQLRPPRLKPVEAPAVIGYMGSDTHLPDLESLTPVFLHLADRFGRRVQFRFFGCRPPEAILALPQTEWLPEQIFDYPRWGAYTQEQDCDILVAPLLGSLFNRCKSAVKLLEYSTLGVACVASRLAPYEPVIVHGVNGFLASTLDEWEGCLARLVEDPNLRFVLASRLQETIRESWLLSDHAGRWVEAYRLARVAARWGDAGQRAEQADLLRNMAHQTLLLIHRQAQAEAGALVPAQPSQDQVAQLESRLVTLQSELDEIHGSRAWSLVQKLWRLRLALAPKGSQTEKWLKK